MNQYHPAFKKEKLLKKFEKIMKNARKRARNQPANSQDIGKFLSQAQNQGKFPPAQQNQENFCQHNKIKEIRINTFTNCAVDEKAVNDKRHRRRQ